MVVLNDIWSLEISKNFKLLAGKQGLSHPVSWLYICQENDIEQWIQGNEILILYGAGVDCTKESLVHLVKICSNCNIAAIMLLTGAFIVKVPERMITAADAYSIPLIEVPYTIPISLITKEIANMIIGHDKLKKGTSGEILRNMLDGYQRFNSESQEMLVQAGYKWGSCNRVFILQFESVECLDRIYGIVRKLLDSELETKTFYARNESLIGLSREGLGEYGIKTSLENVVQEISRKYQVKCRAAMGAKVISIEEMEQSYRMAEKALLLGRRFQIEKKVLDMQSFPIVLQLLSIDYDKEILEDILENQIKILLDYDREKGTELTRTLEVYLLYNSNIKEAAEHLFIHKNTMTYRLKQVEKITGKDLSNESVRYEFMTAYLCWQYLLLSKHKTEDSDWFKATMTSK